ncbi:hypothetical protein [Streptomyces nigra]|uniref:hypothetical protein n=1 Tax=Streptomyces nigra TaxID=1827580 RepID=UPI003416A0C5
MKLKGELPVDHHLATVYRYGAGFCGVVLLVFAGLGYADALSPFDTAGDTIAGMTTDVALSTISTVVGLALLAGAVIAGNVPYWQRRHPQQAAREREAAAALPDTGRQRHLLPATQSPEGTADGRAPEWRPPTRGKR